MTDTKKLDELIRDASEIHDLLEAYGEEAPPDRKAARARLLELLEHVGETRLLSTLLEFARGFAQMSQEIFDFCEGKGVGIAGQIQVKTDEVFLEKTALNSGWAFSGDATWSTGAEERADALANALSGLVQRLAPEHFIKTLYERYETELGRSLHRSQAPESQVLRRVLRSQTYRTRAYDAFSEGDYKTLKGVSETLAEAQGELASAPLPAGVVSAFAELETRCNGVLDRMMATAMIDDREATSTVTTLADEIQILSMQVRSLAQDVAEAQRVDRGFSDFLRTEFWFQRWRIYELWLLVRVLKVLERAGGEIQPNGVKQGTWHLHYGRAQDPVASCTFPEGVVDVYYQLFRESAEGADMPDIAILTRGGRAVLVLDPKHGYSYTRSRVQEVLTRYAQNLNADLTAIVNYFPVRSYQFDAVRWDTRRWILASDVSPHSIATRRLELNFTDVLLARGYGHKPRLAKRPVVTAKRVPARAAYLFYWADGAREVDEPSGPWAVPEQGGPVPLPRFAELVGKKPDVIEVTADGEVCMLQVGNQLHLLKAGHKDPQLLAEFEEPVRKTGWNPQGTLFLVQAEDQIHVFDRGGKPTATIRVPTTNVWGRTTFGWTSDGKCILYGYRAISDQVVVYRLDNFTTWHIVLEHTLSSTWDSVDWKAVPLGPDQGTLLRLSGRDVFLLHAEGVSKAPEGSSEILSASPRGCYQILKGPNSLRAEEGVNLLSIKDMHQGGTSLPFVRFFGEVESEIRWSPDESRVAFLARRRSSRDWPEARLLSARIGDRHALPISMPGQSPSSFAWLRYALLKPYLS